ncbi:hypothetical protein [Tranquillimonas rosea]|uniref:hypothetical protein n=1 Tax=Tranquillimonas rosea TaxID=641238 RepID=UPI003BA9EA35
MIAINNIDPITFRDFMKAHGWTIVEEGLKDNIYVFRNSDYRGREIAIPTEKSAPDYFDALEVSLLKLNSLLGSDSEQLVHRIMSTMEDVIRIRVYSDHIENSIPLNFASTLVKNVEKMLKAAACTVVRPRANHPRLSMGEATQLIENSKFGQTEEGSFIITVSCPVEAMDSQGVLNFSEQDREAPFVRKVFGTAHDAMALLQSSIKSDTVEQLVEQTKTSQNPIISANFCEALTAMHDDGINNSLDAMFSWSSMRKRGKLRTDNDLIFQRAYFPLIEEVRRELRSVEESKVETFIGTVERLEGELGDDGRRAGGVVLSLLLSESDEMVRARVSLDADHYERADQAHMTNGAYVRVNGRLLHGRQPQKLVENTIFELLQ